MVALVTLLLTHIVQCTNIHIILPVLHIYVIFPGPMLLELLFTRVINSRFLLGMTPERKESCRKTVGQWHHNLHYFIKPYLLHPYSAMQRHRVPNVGDHQTVVLWVVIKPRLDLPGRGHRQLVLHRPLVTRRRGGWGPGRGRAGGHCRCLARHGVIGSNNGID